MEQTVENPSSQIMQFITAKWISQPLYVAARLGIADILSAGTRSIHELSSLCNADTDYLYRIMRALAGVGIFSEKENKVFGLTPAAECLQKDKMKPIALLFLSEWHNAAWENLFNAVVSGSVPFETAHGMSAFEWLKKHPEEAKIFHEANSIKAMTAHAQILDTCDFSRFTSVADIGGGYGGLLIRILQEYEHLTGTIADRSYLKRDVTEILKKHKLNRRCRFAECDFFKNVPEDLDCYILSNILHDWDDGSCSVILSNLHSSMKKGARLLIVESIIPPGNVFSVSKLLDLEMLVMGGGKERTEAEFRKLISGTGFNLERIIQTRESLFIIECSK